MYSIVIPPLGLTVVVVVPRIEVWFHDLLSEPKKKLPTVETIGSRVPTRLNEVQDLNLD